MSNKPTIDNLPEYAHIYNERLVGYVKGWQNVFKVQETIKFVDNKTFDGTITSFVSESFECGKYKKFDLLVDLDVTGTPTLLTIAIEFSDDGVNWYKLTTGPFSDLSYGNAQGDVKEVIQGEVNSQHCRLNITTTGTSAAATFKLTSKINFSS